MYLDVKDFSRDPTKTIFQKLNTLDVTIEKVEIYAKS